jgi:diacylglycerol O-acyltransferase
MKAQIQSRRLSGMDAAFLYLERKEIPLHIASVCVFEEAIPFEEFVAAIDSKLHLIPRYRQIVSPSPFNIGYPTWEAYPKFNIRRHIVRAHLKPPGDEAALEELAGRIFSKVMDRSRPLWDIHVVDGLKDGRGALIPRIHHALADGIAGASLLKVMLDATPATSHAIGKQRTRQPKPKSVQPSIAKAIGDAVYSTLDNLIAAEAGYLGLTQTIPTERMQAGLQGLVGLLPELAKPVERYPFNRPCSGDRKFCWTEVDFNDVQAIRSIAGGTVNDIMLTVVTRAVAQYIKLHGQSVAGRYLRVVCPVSFRHGDNGESLGNQISFLPVTLPLDVRNPVELLRGVCTRMEIMKSIRTAELIGLLGSWIGIAPPSLQSAFWWNLPLLPLPVPLFNMICTNVPGSREPLYAVGKRMVASYPQVPTGHELGVNCAVQSYDGKLFFGLIADAHVVPDVRILRDFIQDSFAQLCRSAGVKSKGRKSNAIRKRRAAPKPKPALTD